MACLFQGTIRNINLHRGKKLWTFRETLESVEIYKSKKGKAIPLHAWTSPESSRRLRLPDFKTIGT
jgi:hypothetical protein